MSKAADLSNAFGFLYLGEVEALARIAETLPENGTMVNIGAGVGTSSLTVAEIRPDVKIVTVDISEGGPNGGLENERNAFKNAELDERLPEQLLGDSKEIGLAWDREKVDLIFIDGDHSDAGVRGDIDAWLRHVKDGGIIAFHDYNKDVWRHVTSAVDEYMNGSEIVEKVDTFIAFRISNNGIG